jgi:hypothetical protein
MTDWSTLLSDLRPMLVYDSREIYFADAASSLVSNAYHGGPCAPYETRLMRGKQELRNVRRAGGLELGSLGDRYRDGSQALADDFLSPGLEPAADARRLHESADHANVIYGRVAPRKGGGRWLQYWFFYFMSSKGVPGVRSATGPLGFGLHEGDWEMIQIAVPEGGGKPLAATYAAHDHGHKIDWGEVELEPGMGAPIVYVALNSHASYPRQGRWKGKKILGGLIGLGALDDWCDGRGARLRPTLQEVNEKTTPWLRWPGRWGSTDDSIGTRSPRGPAQQDKWKRPDNMHAHATPWRERWAGRPSDLEAAGVEPPALPVTVTRDGGRVTVSFELPEGLEDEWAGQLTLALNSPAGPPEARVYDVTTPGVHQPG